MPNLTPIVLGVLVLVAIGAGAFWFIDGRNDDSDGSGSTYTSGASGIEPVKGVEPAKGSPGAAAQSLLHAVLTGDDETACRYISSTTLDALAKEGYTCKQVIKRALTQIDPEDRDNDIVILGEEIDGDRAEVSVRVTADSTDDPMVLVREDGRWKADLFAEPKGSSSADDASEGSCAIDIRVVETAAEAYNAKYGRYPPDLDALVGEFLQSKPANVELGPDGTVKGTGDCAWAG